MYSISEVSKMFNLSVPTLRYYDKEGIIHGIERDASGIRIFTEDAIGSLKMIECLKKSGLSIKDIKKYMDWIDEGDSTLEKRKQLFEDQRKVVLQEMQELQKVLNTLDYKCWYYDQAIEKEDEGYVQALSFEQLPPQIQQYYQHSHEDC